MKVRPFLLLLLAVALLLLTLGLGAGGWSCGRALSTCSIAAW